MAAPVSCPHCDAALFSPVRFCPFCGAPQQAATSARPPPVAPIEATIVVLSTPIEPTVAPQRMPLGQAEPVPPPRPAPEPVPEPVPEPALRWSDGRIEPAIGAAASSVPRFKRDRQARERSVRPPNPHRARAIRKLLAAAFVLVCATILWRQLVAVPHGTLRVHLAHPANGRVLVDGIVQGAPDGEIDLSPGRYSIGLEAPGFDTPSREVRIKASESTSVLLTPIARPAEVALDTTPSGAAISVDGRPIGRTPLRRRLAAGMHRIVATAPNMQPATRDVAVEPGDSTPLTIVLEPVPLRRMRLEAPAGQWSASAMPGAGTRFTLLFSAPIRVRLAGHVVLLEPGTPVELGAADASGLSVTAVGPDAVPVQLLIVPADGSGGGSANGQGND